MVRKRRLILWGGLCSVGVAFGSVGHAQAVPPDAVVPESSASETTADRKRAPAESSPAPAESSSILTRPNASKPAIYPFGVPGVLPPGVYPSGTTALPSDHSSPNVRLGPGVRIGPGVFINGKPATDPLVDEAINSTLQNQ